MQSIKELINQRKVIIVGSGSQADWRITDSLIDEKHCQISFLGENKYLIADLGSRNGTFVNNEKVTHKEITENDFIAIGAKIFQLKSACDIAEPVKNETAKVESEHLADTISINSEEEIRNPENPQAMYGSAYAAETDEAAREPAGSSSAEHATEPRTLRIYCLYAHEDEAAAIFLDKHLAALKHNQKIPIEVIGNFNRKAGDDRGTDNEQLKNANIILVFISADLISNESSYNKTMMAIDNHNKGKSLLLPILTRRCMWKDTPFSQLPLLPKNLEPLYSKKSWESEDDSFSNVVSEIKNSIDIFYKKEQEYKQVNNTAKTNPNPNPFVSNLQLKTDFRAGYYWGIFWKRLMAYLIDSMIIYLPLGILFYFLNEDNMGYDYETGGQQFSVMQTLLMCAAAIMIFAYFESSNNMATPGKKILGLVITDRRGEKLSFQKAFVRNLIKYLLILLTANPALSVLYIGGQIAFYAAKHQFFQDILSRTSISPKIKTA